MNTFNGSLIFCAKINDAIDSAPQGPPHRAHPTGPSQPQNQARPCTHTHKRHKDAHARSPIWSVVSRAKGKRVVTRVSEMLNLFYFKKQFKKEILGGQKCFKLYYLVVNKRTEFNSPQFSCDKTTVKANDWFVLPTQHWFSFTSLGHSGHFFFFIQTYRRFTLTMLKLMPEKKSFIFSLFPWSRGWRNGL